MLSVIIITKNEEAMIGDCLSSVAFADEIIVMDSGSTDKTCDFAKSYGAKVFVSKATNYAGWRNDALNKAKGEWVLFVDADERVDPVFPKYLSSVYKSNHAAYLLPRQNIFLGKPMSFGGWGGEKLIRLFKKDYLTGYKGDLHEQPQWTGTLGELQVGLKHYSHRNLETMLVKTLDYTKFEADARLKAHHPRMATWRFIRVMGTEFWTRFIKLSAWRDGTEGVIDGLFQVFNTFIIYARVWEGQKK